ncbi:SDR family NAD(P)-dependent oxidoreductase [Bauldia litoralis]|uniref:NAD(P)-dependent dehydrogenase, short-chain alcohol dehydrogenase family n=1 Tax=Bauldia litoralis TaxID=665467 RepID=A0A1G6AFT4_9HYPH|nr:SDR family NAD(P)-dependent oxidoreductase [Bauldia litoralis]SDB07136.1 NAD(P)-dependent dehydrogenase, short-chain alcohol dehydrogenase family [Bauldia litoralis]
MLPGLSDKRAIVTGAGRGIGQAICRALAAEGVRVAVADLDEGAANDLAGAIGQGAQGFKIDVRDRDSVESCFAAVETAFGGYDLLCANAGVSSMKLVVDLTDEDWDFNFDVNARGVFLTNQQAVRHFLATGNEGVIVNTASLAAKWGAPWLAHYSASKFAVMGFTQALAREVADKGIRVNCVCPGFVRTGMQEREVAWEATLRGMTETAVVEDYIAQTPMGRLEEPEDVAKAILFLASDLSGFITGEALNVTGGVRMD